MARKIAAGNWKMNGLNAQLSEIETLCAQHPDPQVEIVIAPPATLIATMTKHAIHVAGQDCHTNPGGAHTGDISADMLRDAGASHVITGHSERRTDHGETNATVQAKSAAAHNARLTAIICIGETLSEREEGKTHDVITAQLAGSLPDTVTAQNTIIAYEPVWAIGTGKIATPEQIGDIHDAIRSQLAARFGDSIADAVPILYGGSVKPGNAAEIFAISNVDGALVGGASLKAQDFSGIIRALEQA